MSQDHVFKLKDRAAVFRDDQRYDGVVERVSKTGKPTVRFDVSRTASFADTVVGRANWCTKEHKWRTNLVVMQVDPRTGNLAEHRWQCELVPMCKSLV